MSNKLTKEPRRRGTPLLFLLSVMMMAGAIGLLIFDLVSFSQREDQLSAGIQVAGVRVGGMTADQASAMIEQAFAQPVTLYYENNPIVIAPDSVGFRISTASMLASAAGAAETEGGFWARFANFLLGQEDVTTRNIPLQADYQRTALEALLQDIARRYDQPSGTADFDLQTLTSVPGTSGIELDIEAAMREIDRALQSPTERVVNLPLTTGSSSQASLSTLEDLIIAYLDSAGFIFDGQSTVASVYIQDLTTGEEINILGDVAFTAASTVKVPLLIDYFRVLDREPTQDDAFLMANSLLCSANSTSNLIMSTFLGNGDVFSGVASLTRTAQNIGMRNTYLTAAFDDGSPDFVFGSIAGPQTSPNPGFDTQPDFYNQTTAEDMGMAFNMIYDCAYHASGLMTAYPDGQFNQRECQQMLELMTANDLNRLLQAGLPPGTRISHKNGWLTETSGNAGIVFPPNGRDYIISVFLWEDTEANFQNYERLWPLIEEISRATWNFFSPESPMLTRRADIPRTAQECFQRDATGNITYVYLPPYGSVDLSNINGWRDGSATTPQGEG